MAIVYIHKKKDTDIIFYVGIGKNNKRAYEKKHSRSVLWKNIVNKHGFYVEITHTDIYWEEACVIEKYLISFYGRLDLGSGILCNQTDGGDGIKEWSQDLKNKHSSIQKIIKNRPEEIEKNRNRQLLLMKDPEVRKRLSDKIKSVLGTPEKRLENSIRRKNYFIVNGVEKHSQLMKSVHNRKEVIDANRQRGINQFSSQEARDNMSKIKKEFWSNQSEEYKQAFKDKMKQLREKKKIDNQQKTFL